MSLDDAFIHNLPSSFRDYCPNVHLEVRYHFVSQRDVGVDKVIYQYRCSACQRHSKYLTKEQVKRKKGRWENDNTTELR